MSAGRLWNLVEPFETSFARASSVSPDEAAGVVCSRCGIGDHYVRPIPLAFEWEPGSDIVGDFTWPSTARVVVKRSISEALMKEFFGIHIERVAMVQDPKLQPPKRRTSRSKPRVWLPYAGPELVELWPERVIHFLPASTIKIAHRCEGCGRETRHILGGETKAHRYDREKQELVPDLHPRVPGHGVFVASSKVKDASVFRLEEFSEAIFCTDEVKNFIEREGFTNVDFLEYGDVVEA